ncbi:MAG: antiterminator LoaP [Alkalispirochaeta sp.]
MAARFYVFQILTGEEQRFITLAHKALLRNKLEDTRIWWPRRKLTIRRRGRQIRTLAPLFPGYLIVEAPGMDAPRLRTIRSCTGFVRFLKTNQDIRPLEGEDLELVRHFLSFGEIVEQSKVSFDVNNRIVVQEGPLKGLEGRIIKVDKRKGRAKVQLDMYENSFRIDLGFEMIAESSNEADKTEQTGKTEKVS